MKPLIPLRAVGRPIATKIPGIKSCADCDFFRQCDLLQLFKNDQVLIDKLVSKEIFIRRGRSLYLFGDPFSVIYIVKAGSFKATTSNADGDEKITGFYMPNEIIGLEGVAAKSYTNSVIALEDSEVCVVKFDDLEAASRQAPSLQRKLSQALGQEISRSQTTLLMLGSMSAESRVVTYLLDLGTRYAALGYSGQEFHLRMTRADIGSYLGLTLETVSRVLSRFQSDGLIEVDTRRIKLIDLEGLKSILRK